MVRLKIDDIDIEVPKGTTVLQAARKLGIDIPTMCYMEGYENRASCLVCMVKEKGSGKLNPSCALQVAEGMDIITNDDEVFQSRQQSLELLLSDHVGDCEAPCRTGCPAFINIPKMNRMIAEGRFLDAHKLVKQELALPLLLGHICEAPCEKVCRRREVDTTVAICQLIKFVAANDLKAANNYRPEKAAPSGKRVAVVGSGPAGLSAAYHTLEKGHSVSIFDQNDEAGGSLRTEQRDKKLPVDVLESEVKNLHDYGAEFKLGVAITEAYFHEHLNKEFDAIIFAGGLSGQSFLDALLGKNAKGILKINTDTFETEIPGFFVCGSSLKSQSMAIKVVAQGKAVALSADVFLHGLKPVKQRRIFNSKFGKLNEVEKTEYMKEAADVDQILPSEGLSDGYIMEEARKEASRCMHCDCRKVDNCKLRIYADDYSADRRKFLFGQRKSLQKFGEHETVIYEPEKCIRCSLCVDITKHHKEDQGLTEMGRGFNVQIMVPFQTSIKNALKLSADECVRACPTAALAYKETDKNLNL